MLAPYEEATFTSAEGRRRDRKSSMLAEGDGIQRLQLWRGHFSSEAHHSRYGWITVSEADVTVKKAKPMGACGPKSA